MRYLSLAEVLVLHERLIVQSGGAAGLRDLGSLESALAQPRATFDGVDLYPDLADKAAALATHWSAITRSWTATSESAMPPWKSFSS